MASSDKAPWLLRLIYHPWMPLELVKIGNYFVQKWQRRKWERLGKK